MIDSGADDCLVPLSFAAELGLSLDAGAIYEFGGVGSPRQEAIFFPLTLMVPGFSPFPVNVGFTQALEYSAIGILGQNGFFDRFTVEFDLRNGIFRIED